MFFFYSTSYSCYPIRQPDAAAHDYGPHHEGAREALDETDRRIGHILRLLDEQGIFDSTLFIITTDHGMATQDVTLNANPARIPERTGMAAITTEPFVYLRDLNITVHVQPDGRTARVTVLDNDADTTGERPPLVADILVSDHTDGRVAKTATGVDGVAGFAIPPDMRAHDLRLAVHADGFNSRHMLMDGSNLALDLRHVLYGS